MTEAVAVVTFDMWTYLVQNYFDDLTGSYKSNKYLIRGVLYQVDFQQRGALLSSVTINFGVTNVLYL